MQAADGGAGRTSQGRGESDLFGLGAGPAPCRSGHRRVQIDVPKWSDALRLAGEREDVGSVPDGASDHRVRARARRARSSSAASQTSAARGRSAPAENRLARSWQERNARGSRARDPPPRRTHDLVLDDRSGRIEVTLFDDVFASDTAR